jgi:flagellar biosynthesis/type III secretory pathway protein FliH
MKLFTLKNTLIGSILGSFILLGAIGTASAQNYNDEYREWQEAQRRAQEEYRDYLRTRSRSDYRDWQEAKRRAQQEYSEYRRTAGYNNRYTNRAGGSRFYRIYRNGSYYQTDNRGAELLRQAVNSGYRQGYQQGQLDARYNRGGNYYGNSMYRSGTYGYQSYVDRSQYQYYFQQGFQRGYEDGFNNQYRYGYRSNSGLNILGNILNGILQISQN